MEDLKRKGKRGRRREEEDERRKEMKNNVKGFGVPHLIGYKGRREKVIHFVCPK